MKPEYLVSTQEACKLLDITRPTLLAWIAQGKVKAWGQIGGHAAWFFLKRDLERMKVRKYNRSRGLEHGRRRKPNAIV